VRQAIARDDASGQKQERGPEQQPENDKQRQSAETKQDGDPR
jgi:hypothetical protein